MLIWIGVGAANVVPTPIHVNARGPMSGGAWIKKGRSQHVSAPRLAFIAGYIPRVTAF